MIFYKGKLLYTLVNKYLKSIYFLLGVELGFGVIVVNKVLEERDR